MEDHEQGREDFATDEEYQLHCLRHSATHVMAQAIMAFIQKPSWRLVLRLPMDFITMWILIQP